MGHSVHSARKGGPVWDIVSTLQRKRGPVWDIVSTLQGREVQDYGTWYPLCKKESSRVVGHNLSCARKRVPELWDIISAVQEREFQSCGA